MLAGAAEFIARNAVVIQIESYGRDTAATEALARLGLTPVAAIGPDQYLTNRPEIFCDACVSSALQAAASEMVKATKAQRRNGDGVAGTIRVPIAPGLGIEVSGPAVRLARRAVRKLGKVA